MMNPLVLVVMSNTDDGITRVIVEAPHPIASAEDVLRLEKIAAERLRMAGFQSARLALIGFQRLEHEEA